MDDHGRRQARTHWKKGYATEAAKAAIDFGFSSFDLKEVVSFTVPANQRSIAVMERLKMIRDPEEDFDHPRLSEGDKLRRHLLYRLKKQTGDSKEGITKDLRVLSSSVTRILAIQAEQIKIELVY